MRSRPYTPPPALPPLLAELSTFLPNRDRRSDESDRAAGAALFDLDPETSRLLPAQQERERPQHCVRVQGRLAPVRSVSVAATTPRSTSQTRFDAAVSGTAARARARRRRSSDDLREHVHVHAHAHTPVLSTSREDEEAGSERDAQLRGYGIGGRGNIRRPTDVIGTQSSSASSLSALSLFSGTGSTHRSYLGSGADNNKKFSLSGILNRIEERRGRERSVRI
ncbi:uncharacterized protein F4812DRAFT_446437 [Daldinia caldariorum]|uniref:uncharacterized protein n=1 Tax=Daldinia caldariorum TaxID=326644 RepID=UPI002007AC7F|nr:uncharacterized protein F4812DRAFT_446437 [Daldinia caldariorum]KAI1463530.1 hypothetical protein F4812DRAFT_446437 [Daldinia caldariorum]